MAMAPGAAPGAGSDVGRNAGAADVKPEPGYEAEVPQEPFCPYPIPAFISMEPDRKKGRLDGSAVAVLALANNAKVASPYPDWTYARDPEFTKVLNGELDLRKDGCYRDQWTPPLVHHLLHCYESLQVSRRAECHTKGDWQELAVMLATHPDCSPPKTWRDVRSKFEKLRKRFLSEKTEANSRWPYFADMLSLQNAIDRVVESADSPVQGARMLLSLEPGAAGPGDRPSPLPRPAPLTPVAVSPPSPPAHALLLPPVAGPPPPPVTVAASAQGAPSGAGTEAAVTSVSSRGASHPPLGASGISFHPADNRMFREACLSIRSRISRAPVYGAYCASFSPMIAEILGLAKFDFVVVDLEYGPCDHAHTLPVLHALASAGCPSILRLPARPSGQVVRRALDLGPSGIMFADIDTAEGARKLVQECRTNAGRPLVRSSLYGTAARMDANELFIICEVSSVTALSNVAEIASIEGVDCIQIVPLALRASMGIFHDVNQPHEFMRKAEEAVINCNAHRRTPVYLAGLANAELPPAALLNLNYHMVSGASDIALLRDAAMADVANNKVGRAPQPNSLAVKPELFTS